MTNLPQKVFIKIETSAEQQENIKQSRRTLKILQHDATDKENLVGRTSLVGKTLVKSKTDVNFTEIRRKRMRHQCSQTEDSINLEISAEDLTSEDNPSESYWQVLAERRRKALDETLEENAKLYERIDGLEDELETSRKMLDEAKNLVEVLTEMLSEGENAGEITGIDVSANGDQSEGDRISGEASTSGLSSSSIIREASDSSILDNSDDSD